MITKTPTKTGTSRDVVFNLKTVVDPSNTKELKTLLKDLRDAQKAAENVYPKMSATKQQLDGIQKYKSSIKDMVKEVNRLAAEESKRAAKLQEEAKKLIEDSDARMLKQLNIEQKKHKKIYDLQVKEQERLAKENKAAADKAIAEQKRVTEEQEREFAKRVRAYEIDSAKRQDILRRNTQAFIQAKKQEADAAMAVASRGSLSETSRTLMSGGLDLGRGIAMSGLIGEQDASKLLDTLLKIEAAYSSVKGGIEIYEGLSGAVRNYILALQAAKVAEESLAAVRKAEVAASSMMDPATGIMIPTVTSAAGAAGASSGAGTAAAVGGTGVAGAAGSLVSVIGAVVAALAAMAAAVIVVKEQIDGTAASGEGMSGFIQRQVRPWTDAYPNASNIIADAIQHSTIIGPLSGGVGIGTRYSDDAVRRAEGVAANTSSRISSQERVRKYLDAINDNSARRYGAEDAADIHAALTTYANVTFGAKDQEKLLANRAASLKLGNKREDLEAMIKYGTRSDSDMAKINLSNLRQEQLTLLKEELSLVTQIANTETEGSKEKVRALEEQKRIQQSIFDEAKNRLMSGKERFGSMAQSEQSRLIEVQRAFNLASEIEKSGRPEDIKRAEGIRANIPIEDRQKLAGLGLTAGVEGNRKAASENADRNGFSMFFGAEENSAMSSAAGKIDSIGVNIANENKIQVNINANLGEATKELVRKVREEMAITQNEQDSKTRQMVAEEMDKAMKQAINEFKTSMNDSQGKDKSRKLNF
jgi:hypothetical protein